MPYFVKNDVYKYSTNLIFICECNLDILNCVKICEFQQAVVLYVQKSSTNQHTVCWQVFARNLMERQSVGAIVNMSSQASKRALTNHVVYCTSKAAVDQLTRSLAFELGPHGVRFL